MADHKMTKGERELALATINGRAHFWTSVIATTVRCAAVVLCVKYIMIGLQGLSGKSTVADIGIRIFTDFKISEAAAYLFGGAGFAYGYGQRVLRRKRIGQLSDRTTELEKSIDPYRSSSGLLRNGKTRKEDRI